MPSGGNSFYNAADGLFKVKDVLNSDRLFSGTSVETSFPGRSPRPGESQRIQDRDSVDIQGERLTVKRTVRNPIPKRRGLVRLYFPKLT